MKLLERLNFLWLEKIKLAQKAKQRLFDNAAAQIEGYLGRASQVLSLTGDQAEDRPFLHAPQPGDSDQQFQPRRNLAADYQSALLPYVLNTVPKRSVSVESPLASPELLAALPALQPYHDQAVATGKVRVALLQWMLDWLPEMYNLGRESRQAIMEALIKGRSCLWTELWDSPYGPLPGTFFGTVDNLLIDPDAISLREAGWIVRKRRWPCYRIAEEFGEPVEDVRTASKSYAQTAADNTEPEAKQREASGDDQRNNDLGEFFEVYSRVGMGHQLLDAGDDLTEQKDFLDGMGRNVRLAVMEGMDHPLGMSADRIKAEGSLPQDEAPLGASEPQAPLSPTELEARRKATLAARTERFRTAVQWPLRLHQNPENPWPVVCMDFYPNADCPWPRPPLESSLPLLKFIDHLFSFVFDACRNASRVLIITAKHLDDAVKQAIERGYHNEIVEMAGENPGKALKELIEILTFPNLSADLWRVIPLAMDAFRESSGMLQTLVGAQPDAVDRSAQATEAREGHLESKPRYLAKCVEDALSQVARAEGIVLRRHIAPQTIAALFNDGTALNPNGEFAVMFYDKATGDPMFNKGPLVAAWETTVMVGDDEAGDAQACFEIDYSVVAGSGLPKNQQGKISAANQIMQTFGQMLQQIVLATGSTAPIEPVFEMMGEGLDTDLSAITAGMQAAFGQMQMMQMQAAQQQVQQPQFSSPQEGGQPPIEGTSA